jgi:predicted branched-subunit amino acid permease
LSEQDKQETLGQSIQPTDFSWQEFRLGLRDAMPAQLGIAPWGIAFGLLATQVGLTAGQALGMSFVVFSGTAQMVILEFWREPFAWAAVLLAVFAINSRYILQTASLSPWIEGRPFFQRVFLYWTIVDISWALSLERIRVRQAEGRVVDVGYLWGSNLVCFFMWIASSALGAYLPLQQMNLKPYGFDLAVSAILLALLGTHLQWRSVRSTAGLRLVLSLALSLGLAWLTRQWLGGQWYVLVGGIAGALLAAQLGQRESA